METDSCHIPPARPRRSLKPSLVEWKLLQWGQTLDETACLETFLSGMETFLSDGRGVTTGGLETFLSGMETTAAADRPSA